MKVLHLVGGSLSGGAARGAYCIHTGLKELGIRSMILTNSRTTLGDSSVVTINTGLKTRLLAILRGRFESLPLNLYRRRRSEIYSTGFCGYDFTQTPEYKEADIIHLHWINAGFVNIKHLSKVEKPIVWTMHDMWPMTGGCHIAMDCDRYTSLCGKCPRLNSKTRWDLSRFVINRKKKYLPRKLVPVGISSWLSDKAKTSFLLHSFDLTTIHNTVDTKTFFPVEKSMAREILRVPKDRKIICVAAQNLMDVWKGFGKFLQAIELLDKNEYFLCIMGNCEQSLISQTGFDYKYFGFLQDNISIQLVYSAANVFVAPSIIESFGRMLIEALACATPVVCFDATGPKDIIDHKVDGYKAEPFSFNDLATGIRWVCEHPHPSDLHEAALSKVKKQFDLPIIARQYINLYEKLLRDE